MLAVVVQTSFGFKEISRMGSMLEGFKVQVPMPVPMPGEKGCLRFTFLGIAWPRGEGFPTQPGKFAPHGIVFFVFFVVCFFSVTSGRIFFFPLLRE